MNNRLFLVSDSTQRSFLVVLVFLCMAKFKTAQKVKGEKESR